MAERINIVCDIVSFSNPLVRYLHRLSSWHLISYGMLIFTSRDIAGVYIGVRFI
jgi:hypothetical protein